MYSKVLSFKRKYINIEKKKNTKTNWPIESDIIHGSLESKKCHTKCYILSLSFLLFFFFFLLKTKFQWIVFFFILSMLVGQETTISNYVTLKAALRPYTMGCWKDLGQFKNKMTFIIYFLWRLKKLEECFCKCVKLWDVYAE